MPENKLGKQKNMAAYVSLTHRAILIITIATNFGLWELTALQAAVQSWELVSSAFSDLQMPILAFPIGKAVCRLHILC